MARIRQRQTPEPEKTILNDLEAFLRLSATNDEWMPDSLRTHLHVSTGLEEAVREAVENAMPIAITGTAGSGKSHLLRAVVSASSGYTIIPDLTEKPEHEWSSYFNKSKKIVVAGNEGAFLLGKKNGVKGFAEIIDSLHAIQAGDETSPRHNIMVIDAAGFDAAGQHVVASMLQLPVLAELARERCGDLAKSSWAMLGSKIVRERVAVLVEIASAHSDADGFTFRQLWQFVADILLGAGKNDPWFVQLFAGNTEISRRIGRVFQASSVPLPHIGNRLWHADLHKLEPLFVEESREVLKRLVAELSREEDSTRRIEIFRRLRILSLFALEKSPLDRMLKAGTELWATVTRGECRGLLQSINRYFSFGLIDFGDDLELWIQHDTERRDLKPGVQISLGTAAASDFELVKSLAICNPPAGFASPKGGRRLLRHKPSKAVLHVTKDLVDGIVKIRSHRMHDRRDIEYDWRLARFFEKVASKSARPDRLQVAEFNFQARSGRVIRWQITNTIQKVGS
jgi:hypothetical protein